MKRDNPPGTQARRRIARTIAVLVIAFIAVMVPTWYRIWAGAEKGGFETLEADIAAQRQVIETVLEDSLGDYEILGERVDVGLCYLHNHERDSWTRVIAQPVDISPHEGVEAMADDLRRRGFHVEPLAYGNGGYATEIRGFPHSLWFFSSDTPEPGIEVTLGGGCYTADRIETTDPDRLAYEIGLKHLHTR